MPKSFKFTSPLNEWRQVQLQSKRNPTILLKTVKKKQQKHQWQKKKKNKIKKSQAKEQLPKPYLGK